MNNTAATETAKAPMTRKCNLFPGVWGAILGCTGQGTHRGWDILHMGKRDVLWGCETCAAARKLSDSTRGQAHQDLLRGWQAAAGVENYRFAKWRTVGGRPVLVR